jgi:hypothetical protein
MQSLWCPYICVSTTITSEWLKLGIHTMAYEPISATYFMNISHQSLCLYVYLHIATTQRLDKNITTATNTHAIIKELRHASFLCRPCRIKEFLVSLCPSFGFFVTGISTSMYLVITFQRNSNIYLKDYMKKIDGSGRIPYLCCWRSSHLFLHTELLHELCC